MSRAIICLPSRTPLLATLFALILASCASFDGVNFTGKIATPAGMGDKTLSTSHLASVEKNANPKTEWPAEDWWTIYGNQQLNGLIAEALKGNPDLKIADARLHQAASSTLNAEAKREVTMTARTTVQGIRVPQSVLPNATSDAYFTPKALGIDGSYTFDLWGGQRAVVEAALGEQKASEVDVKAARLTLSVEVARNYEQLANVYRANFVATRELDRSTQMLKLTSQRVTAGIESVAAQREIEAQVASAARRVAETVQEVDSQKITLAILIGKGPDRAAEIERPTELLVVPLELPENLPADLIGRRPDIVAARWRVEAAQHGIEASKAGFYPSFNLTAALGLISFHTDDLLSLRSKYYAVAPAISLPIFNTGRLRAKLAERNAEYDIAVAEYNKMLVTAFNQVALYIQTTHSLAAQATEQKKSVEAMHQAREFAKQRYERGIGSYADVLVQDQSVYAAEGAMASIRMQQIDNAILMVHSLGGGYQAATTTTAAKTPETPGKPTATPTVPKASS